MSLGLRSEITCPHLLLCVYSYRERETYRCPWRVSLTEVAFTSSEKERRVKYRLLLQTNSRVVHWVTRKCYQWEERRKKSMARRRRGRSRSESKRNRTLAHPSTEDASSPHSLPLALWLSLILSPVYFLFLSLQCFYSLWSFWYVFSALEICH